MLSCVVRQSKPLRDARLSDISAAYAASRRRFDAQSDVCTRTLPPLPTSRANRPKTLNVTTRWFHGSIVRQSKPDQSVTPATGDDFTESSVNQGSTIAAGAKAGGRAGTGAETEVEAGDSPPVRSRQIPASAAEGREAGDVDRTHVQTATPLSSALRKLSTTASASHASLTSFLAYASRANLSPTSTVFLGTQYEYLVQEHLQTYLSFTLERIGGRGDSGIDLLGTWDLARTLRAQSQASSPISTTTQQNDAKQDDVHGDEHGNKVANKIPTGTAEDDTNTGTATKVLIQCKRFAPTRTATPSLIRELEGSFLAAPLEYRSTTNTLGIMACTRPATKGIRDAMARSRRPLAWFTIEEVRPDHDQAGTTTTKTTTTTAAPHTVIRQMLWNQAATQFSNLQGVDVSLRHFEHSPRAGTILTSTPTTQDKHGQQTSQKNNNNINNRVDSEVVLLYKGSMIDLNR